MELKTLKDCCVDFHITGGGFVDLLRQEAIKWVKEIESGREVATGKMSFKWDKFSPYTGAAGAVLIDFIKHFFILTEEELTND